MSEGASLRDRAAAASAVEPASRLQHSQHPLRELPQGHFKAILADPPWPFATWSHKGQGRSGEAHYNTMTHSDLEAMPVRDLAAPDSVLFLWVVQTQIPQAVRLVDAWGFELKSVAFAWMKGDELPFFPDDVTCQMGMGKWTRAEFEQCWLATRGKPKRLNADVRQVLVEKRRQHSRKPDGIHHRIERLVDGPRLEMFARQQRPGWTVWGNQTDKFAAIGIEAATAGETTQIGSTEGESPARRDRPTKLTNQVTA